MSKAGGGPPSGPPPMAGPVGGGDMMSEMANRLKARRAKTEAPASDVQHVRII